MSSSAPAALGRHVRKGREGKGKDRERKRGIPRLRIASMGTRSQMFSLPPSKGTLHGVLAQTSQLDTKVKSEDGK